MYYERQVIVSVLRSILGSDVEITFTCVDTFEQDDSDDIAVEYSGKFGANQKSSIASTTYFTSLPTVHFEKFYVERRDMNAKIS